MKQFEVINALQKEVRRNYEINFDAQFSHNNTFKLKCLGTLAAISVGALVVGLMGIAFPPLIPITLAAAIITTTFAATTLSVTAIGLFGSKSKKSAVVEQKTLNNGLAEKDGLPTPKLE